MPLVRNDDLVRIDLPAEGEWVMVKRRLSRGDEIAVQQAPLRGSRVSASNSDGTVTASTDASDAIEAREFFMLELVIRSWSFDVPVTPRAIRELDGESVDAIKVALNELYAPRTDDERKNSVGPMPPPFSLEAARGTTPSSHEAPYPLSSAG